MNSEHIARLSAMAARPDLYSSGAIRAFEAAIAALAPAAASGGNKWADPASELRGFFDAMKPADPPMTEGDKIAAQNEAFDIAESMAADPPAAGDALPPLPKEAAAYQVGCNQRIWPGDFLYTADQMRAYALAAQEAAK